eukprot:SAG11_NODE_547_length_8604_cov_4.710641_4_plen_59_part_00
MVHSGPRCGHTDHCSHGMTAGAVRPRALAPVVTDFANPEVGVNPTIARLNRLLFKQDE